MHEPNPAGLTTAFILLIGDELLSGKVADGNGTHAVVQLRRAGVDVLGCEIVPDDPGRIAGAIRRVRHDLRPTVIITSGGVGPTHDDVTIPAVARALGLDIVVHAEFEQRIRDHFRGRLTDAWLAMARLPEGAGLVFEDGFFPLIRVQDLAVLPGDPDYFRRKLCMLIDQLAADRPAGGAVAGFTSIALVVREDEGHLADTLRALAAQVAPDVAIGSYPQHDAGIDAWVTRLTFDSRDPAAAEAAMAEMQSLLAPESIVRVDR
jgi:molybdenum cofactor synthesis domain-containing protein